MVDLQDRRGAERATAIALVVIAVLSSSTDVSRHLMKLENWKVLASLRSYAVLEPLAPVAYVWTRTMTGWPAEPKRVGADGALHFPEVVAVVSLSDLYRPVGSRLG